jgi:hypothetical protein
MIQKIKTMQNDVANMLRRHPELRDDDEKLVTNIWYVEMKRYGTPETLPVTDFLALYQQKKLSSADVITRARRKVQEQYPELRGTTWEERHKQSQTIRKNI